MQNNRAQPLIEGFLPLFSIDSFLFFFCLQGASPAASRLAVSVIQNCAEELETYVCEFLNSCIVNRDAVGSDLKEFYHEILFEVFQCAPQMLLVVIPTLSQELLVKSFFFSSFGLTLYYFIIKWIS